MKSNDRHDKSQTNTGLAAFGKFCVYFPDNDFIAKKAKILLYPALAVTLVTFYNLNKGSVFAIWLYGNLKMFIYPTIQNI